MMQKTNKIVMDNIGQGLSRFNIALDNIGHGPSRINIALDETGHDLP